MGRWFNEPLVHFLLLGGLLFGAYGWLNRGDSEEPRVVRMTSAEVTWLKETWARQWQREPSDEELRGLVADYLKEELLSREAREIGLDENDTIVRRRLAQKMEFLVQDTARLAEPGDDELRRLYDSRRDRYQTPARISFTQIYFKTKDAARKGREELVARRTDELGDQTLLERDYTETDEQTVTNLFGSEFAQKVFSLELGQWQGPVGSGYGFHLVRVSDRVDQKPRAFEEVRSQVLEEWHRVQQAKANEQFLAVLVKKYDVVVDETVRPLIGPFAKVTQ
jgi:parvulin-like peptidyl-prolyl isomerase